MGKRIGGREWPRDFRERFFIGMHTVDTDENATIPDLLCDMDGREIVRQLADAGVEAVYFYASCHMGSCFYPTEAEHGHMHSGLKGRDVFGEAADEAEKLGLAFCACYEFSNFRARHFGPREWQHYYPEPGPGNSVGLCFNTGYGDLVREQIEEISSRYPMAGIHVDMLMHTGPVCCPECARRFKEDVGVSPPREKDPNDPRYQVFRLWTYREEARMLKELRAILQAHQPGATLVDNFHIRSHSDFYELPQALDYLSTDPGVAFGFNRGTIANSAHMAVFRALSRGKEPFEILHDPILHGCLDVLPADPYLGVTAVPAAQGGMPGYTSTFINRRGRLNDAVLGLTKIHASFTKSRAEWKAEGEPVRFAGLYVSQETRDFYAGGDIRKYVDSFEGAYMMLQQEHLPVDVLTRRDLGRLDQYAVVFLPNVVCMSDKDIEAMRRYVARGGTLVASYRTSLADEWNVSRKDFGLSDVFGVTFTGTKADPLFGFQLLLPDGRFGTEPWENRNVTMTQSALVCRLREGAVTLVPLHDRYRRDPDIPFSGLHNAYTREDPLGPGMVENRYGKGRSIYFPGKLFSAYLFSGTVSLCKLAARWPIEGLVRKRCPVRLVGACSVEMTAWAQADRNRLLVHLVNYQTAPGRMHAPVNELPIAREVLPVVDLRLETLFGAAEIRAARMQPGNRELSVEMSDGRAVVPIPRVDIHDIVELQLAEGACPVCPDSNRVFPVPAPDLRERIRSWLESGTPGVDLDDDGVARFDRWRPTEDYLIDWRVAGPFGCTPGHGIETRFGPEDDVSPGSVYAGAGGKEVGWQDFSGTQLNANGWVEMVVRMGSFKEHGFVGYACCTLHSRERQTARFLLGSNDNIKLLLNGTAVYEQREKPEQRRGPDTASFSCDLQQGDNTLLVKVECTGHGMGFYLRIEDPKAELTASAFPGKKGRPAGSRSFRGPEWDGKGELQG